MRVLTVTNMYPTESRPDFGIFVHEQVQSIERLGHDVDVLFMNAKEGGFRQKAYLLGFPRLWKTLAENTYDVIHAHYVFSGVVARAQRSSPLVVTHHGCELVHPWQGPLCKLTRSWADETIVVAPWMVRELGLGDAQIIPCGIDLSLFRSVDRQEARDRLGLDPHRKYVLFAGRMSDPVKRFPLLEQAVRIVQADDPDVEMLVVSGQPHDHIPLYMSAADVFAMTSATEGSAQVVKEAMACNMPIVATDAGDNWTVMGNTEGCYRTSAEPLEIAARLKDAITPPRRTAGRASVERFGIDAIARQVESIYEEAIRHRATSQQKARTAHA